MKKFIFALIIIIIGAVNIKAQQQQAVPDTCKVNTRVELLKSPHNDKYHFWVDEQGKRHQENFAGWWLQPHGGYNLNIQGDKNTYPQHSWVAGVKFGYNLPCWRYKSLRAAKKPTPKFPRWKVGADINIGEVEFNAEKYLAPSFNFELAIEMFRFGIVNPYIGGRGGAIFYKSQGLDDAEIEGLTFQYGGVAGISIHIANETYLTLEAIYNVYQMTSTLETVDYVQGTTFYSERIIQNTPLSFQLGIKFIL